MQFNVSQLLREPIGSRRRYLLKEPFLAPDGHDEVVVEGPVDLLRTDKGILASLRLSATTEGECDRCLAPVLIPLQLEVEEEFLPTVDPVTGMVLPRPDDPEAFTITPQHILDVSEALRQAWLLSRPMQALCRPTCQGLCPICGANRNESNCHCEDQPIDARWAALTRLGAPDAGRPEEN